MSSQQELGALRAGLRSPDASTRWTSAIGLGEAGSRKAVPWMLPALSDPNSEVRMRAAEAIGTLLRDTGKVPRALMQASQDRSELVRIAALEAIGEVGDSAARSVLRRALDDRSALVRRSAATAFATCGLSADRHRLARRLAFEKSTAAKVGYYDALFCLGERQHLTHLFYRLRSRSYRIRCSTANAIASLPLNADERREALRELRAAQKRETTVAGRSSIQGALKHMAG